MPRLLALIATLLLVAACSTAGTAVVPEFRTVAANNCAISCEAEYVGHARACLGQRSGARASIQRQRQCFLESDQVLTQCYSTCERLD